MRALLFLTVLTASTVRHSSASSFPHLSNCEKWVLDKDVDDALKARLERLASRKQTLTVSSGTTTVNLGICANAEGKEAAVVLQETGKPPVAFGRLNANFVTLSGNQQWMSLSYSGGDLINASDSAGNKRSATIVFICDSSFSTPTLQKPIQSDPNHLLLFITSKETCESSGGSFFGTLFMILLIAGLFYLIFGFLYNRLAKGARGFDQIPNYNTWCYIYNSIQEKAGRMTGRGAYNDDMVGGGDRSTFGANHNQSDDAQLLGREDFNRGPVSQRLHPAADSDNDDRLLPL
uniref:Cation-dependent mannose-6-phosphate receptor n=1 Tax=Plectus sambesii TaxID=2011161 RepID=A0A914VKA7_9BILA